MGSAALPPPGRGLPHRPRGTHGRAEREQRPGRARRGQAGSRSSWPARRASTRASAAARSSPTGTRCTHAARSPSSCAPRGSGAAYFPHGGARRGRPARSDPRRGGRAAGRHRAPWATGRSIHGSSGSGPGWSPTRPPRRRACWPGPPRRPARRRRAATAGAWATWSTAAPPGARRPGPGDPVRLRPLLRHQRVRGRTSSARARRRSSTSCRTPWRGIGRSTPRRGRWSTTSWAATPRCTPR